MSLKYQVTKDEAILVDAADHVELDAGGSGALIVMWLAPTDDPEKFDVSDRIIYAPGEWTQVSSFDPEGP